MSLIVAEDESVALGKDRHPLPRWTCQIQYSPAFQVSI